MFETPEMPDDLDALSYEELFELMVELEILADRLKVARLAALREQDRRAHCSDGTKHGRPIKGR